MPKTWKQGDPLPNDYWLNGNVIEMVRRGSYEYFRPKFEHWVRMGKMDSETLESYDGVFRNTLVSLKTQRKFRTSVNDEQEVERLTKEIEKLDVPQKKKEAVKEKEEEM